MLYELPVMFSTFSLLVHIKCFLKKMSVNTTDMTYPKSAPGTYLLKRTPRGTKILIFPVLNKILKI